LLIAGTYTPICVIAFNETIFGYIVLAIEWIGAILGILLKVKDLNNKFIKVITMLLYIIMGWCLMIFPFLIQYLSIYQFIMILSGGILYTIGIVFFIVGAKKKWFHSIFHIFCCLGTVVQMFAIIDMFLL
jgi:hemolysin III